MKLSLFILPHSLSIVGMLDVGMLAVRLLAVVGAVAVGGLGTGWLVKGLAKGIAFRNAPPSLLRISRVLGGVIVGLVVAAWVLGWVPVGPGWTKMFL